ncbi:LacI family transcriptional regulator [Arcticibacter pallidicorallinus]|uniref:LacI family transcriptional regulator n=1 Tax=Arcticibacter pallidicorallinus TaxID=1259464 RepID=A0A2T0U6M8_9SPHI|nr:LacI family DNA-binding transcriptional regulator [Arcticibacter pallidicorallinus]PRY53576.1 LacI family transcriptional regulator [Arcticibacter pallidicorallinus]
MDQVNLKRLAKELNLAISTVSRALSDSYDISEGTKKKVLALAKKLNYQPNPFARSLRNRSSKTIAVILPEIANNYFSVAINGIEEVAQANNYHVLIYITHENLQKEADIVRLLLNGRVDGILMSLSGGPEDTDHLKELQESKVPVVFFDRVSDTIETAKITTNNFESGYLATSHLISRGSQRVAYLTYSGELSIEQQRMKGYMESVSKRGLLFREEFIVCCNRNSAENYEKIKELFSADGRPDGVFASVESLAILAYEVCSELNLRIPEDVKIVGFSNLRTASLLNPALTTITQPAFNMGREAAKALFEALKKPHIKMEDQTIVLRSNLIERRSTAAN